MKQSEIIRKAWAVIALLVIISMMLASFVYGY